MTEPKNVLFVCTGNICRSPLAEVYLRSLIHQGGPADVTISSAGTHAMGGNRTPEEGIETAAHIGLDLESHRAKPLTPELLEQADRIVVMAPEHADFIQSLYPEAADKVEFLARRVVGTEDDTIADPLGGSAFHYRSSYATIAQAVQAFYDETFSAAGAAPVSPGPRTPPPERGRSAHGRRVRVVVPASAANLGPGYDTLGLALQLYNRVTLEEAERDEVRVSGEGESALPTDATNIVFQAVESVFQDAKIERPPLRLTLENTIPLARGLGSSAAARVGGLLAARTWCDLSVEPAEVLKGAEALEGHADNAAPSLLGGLTVAAGAGSDLLAVRAALSEKIQVSLAVPNFEVSTPEARDALPETLPHDQAVFNVQRTALLMVALAEGDGALLPLAMQDRLHQPHRARLMGPIDDAFSAARKAGAAGVALSGAGPTVIALSITGQADPLRIAQAMATPYKDQGIGCTPLTLKIDREGARSESIDPRGRP
ncbi:MAG: homoserine kinase [Nitrospinota bacterium]|nr:homoserine kinase [Nitrospinota bacterium]